MRDGLETADWATELLALAGPLHRHRKGPRADAYRVGGHGQQRLTPRSMQALTQLFTATDHLCGGSGKCDCADRRSQIERLMRDDIDRVAGRVNRQQYQIIR